MKRIPARLILLLIFFGLSHFALEAKACSCYPQDSIYREYYQASAVFDEALDRPGTDELGMFSFQVFFGAEYWIYGESNSSGKGEPIKIKIEDTNKPLKIVIPFPKRR